MDDTIARLLRYDTWAVVGLTPNPVRAAYGVARFLLARGKTVIPVNPTGEAVHGQPAVTHLSEIDVPVDVVDIFRRPEFVPAVVEDAIGVGAKVVWMQIRIFNDEAAQRAEEAGLKVIMGRCMKLEYLKHFGAVVHS